MRRVGRFVALSVAVALTCAGLESAPAAVSSTPTGPGSAHAQAAVATATSGITTTPTVALLPGLPLGLGALLGGVTTTLTSGVVAPLTTALTALPGSVLSSLTTALTSAGLSADSPTTQQQRPDAGLYPTCGQQGWTSADCYGPGAITVAAPPVLGLSVNAAQGYATGDTNGFVAAAHAAAPSLSLLGLPIGNLGVSEATAFCGSAPTYTCDVTQNLTGGSLFGGALTYSVANGTMLASVGATAVGGTTVPVTSGVTASLNGNLLTLSINVSLTQLLTALGLPNLLSSLGIGPLSNNGTTAALTLTLGPARRTVAGTSAEAWGLAVGADLSADIKLVLAVNYLGVNVNVATVEVRTTGTTAPDLVDLKLSYAKALAGSLLPAWVPASLI